MNESRSFNILSQYKLGKDILMTVRERYLIPQK